MNGRLRDAFIFPGEDPRRRRRSSDDSSHKGLEGEEEHIRGKMAGEGSVWKRGQDFWKVLGWAFNCSALYPHRWRWWKPWLEYMVDVLENDYEERKRLDEESAGESESCEYTLLRDSLLVSYVAPKSSRSSPIKPIMNALFADGSSSSTVIFKEIFKNETKVASKSSKKRKRGLDLEKDNYADYADDSSSGGSQPPTPEHQRTTSRTVDETVPWTSSTLAETIPLRLRVFALVRNLAETFENDRTALIHLQLSRAVDDMPDKCSIQVLDLYGSFVEKIALLPVPAFAQFIASLHDHLEQEPIIAIIRVLMPRLVPPGAPRPHTVDRDAADADSVSAPMLEKCYLPFAYKGAENNTKFSLANETIFRILWTFGALQWTPSLQAAVEKGVKARREKSATRKKNDGENGNRDMLRASGSRLLALAELMKMQMQEQEQAQGDDVMEEA